MATPTVHSLCLDLARETTNKVERYLLLRLAMQAERTDVVGVMHSPAMLAIVGTLAPSLGAWLTRLATPRTASTAPAN